MASRNDERDEYIRELYAAGWSAIEIADDTGLSRSQIHRIVATTPELDDDDDADDDSDLDEAEVARLHTLDTGQPVVPPISYKGVDTVATEVKGWDSPLVSRELHYVDAAGHSLTVADVYRYTQELEQTDRWAEADALTAELDRQHAQDPELVLTYDLLGMNPSYEPRESDAVDARWTVMGPSS